MRLHTLILGAVLLTATTGAQAGNLTFGEGKGAWQSTMCTHPARPAALANDPDADANNLNEQINAYNVYTGQIQAYLDCISREAERDIAGSQQTVSAEAHKAIAAAQGELGQIQAQLKQH